MKNLLKLCAVIAALSFAFGFASCKSDDDDSSGSSSVTSSDTSESSTTDTATTYTVTFDTDGGSEVETQTVESGSTASKPATDPTRSGYHFDGWFTAADGDTEFDSSKQITANTTVYAKWSVLYNVEISRENLEGSIITTNEHEAAAGTEITIDVTPEKDYVLATLTVTDEDGNDIETTKVRADDDWVKYTFTMPASDVTVTATFAALLNLTIGEHDFYYVSGETWAQAIANHATENSGWRTDGGYVYYGEQLLWTAHGPMQTSVSDSETISDDSAEYCFRQ